MALAEALKIHSKLKEHYLNNSIGTEAATALAEALKRNSTLHTLDRRRNDIGAEGAKEIAEVLQSNTTLHTIDLQHNKIEDEGAWIVAGALKRYSSRKGLYLGTMAVAGALESNSTIQLPRIMDEDIMHLREQHWS